MNLGAGLRLGRAVLAASLAAAALTAASGTAPAPSFGHAVVVERDGAPQLLVDGKPFFFWGGAFFYERIPASRWRDSMLAMKQLGANTLDIYVPWNWHELADGDFDFDGHTNPRRNLREVLRLARELNLHLIVRPGPVIRNEWRNGGYPAWLLIRPEYRMPLRDVLDGRYPATATLQNAHSDDAAAEWMRNRTHLRYASRWLHRALAEFRPVADLVLAVALDDDQGAYIDNQTYPAPHLQQYLHWLDGQARDVVGPTTPTFINTYEMRVPSSSPVWTMGNWYQSDAYTIGAHDRAGLDFATSLLATNGRGPLAQSEFQAGWLAPAEDPDPRPADPRNTELALHELLAHGVHGIIDFPMQDTLAPFGWEAPFANALYNWDAAIGLDGKMFGTRYAPTRGFGSLVSGTGNDERQAAPALGFGDFLADTKPIYDTAIAWLGGAYAKPLTPAQVRAVTDRAQAELARCRVFGRSCLLIDLRQPVPRVSTLVVPRAVTVPFAADVSATLGSLRRSGLLLVSSVPGGLGGSTIARTVLAGPRAVFVDFRNWSVADIALPSTPYRVRGSLYVLPPLALAAHSARLVPLHVDLSATPGFATGDAILPSTCPLVLDRGQVTVAPQRLSAPCQIAIRVRNHEVAARTASERGLVIDADGTQRPFEAAEPSMPSLGTIGRNPSRGQPAPILLAPTAPFVPVERPPINAVGHDRAAASGRATASRVDVFGDGAGTIVLLNSQLRAIISPDGGGRLIELNEGNAAGCNATDATGALRDDLFPSRPPSARDYIAAYTHAYPSGTAQRRYDATIVQTGSRAVVRLHYVDVTARPVTYERILTLEADSPRLIVDERITVNGGAWSPLLRGVQRSSLPGLLATRDADAELLLPSDAGRSAAAASFVRCAAGAHVTVVAWRPGEVVSATWTRYRSTGTLSLHMMLGQWHRVVYAYAAAATIDEARAFAQAERDWVSANRVSARSAGEVAKR